jgi:hypothetical protein
MYINDLGAGDAFSSFLIDAYLKDRIWLSYETLSWAMVGATLACQTLNHEIDYIDSEKTLELYNRIFKANSK